jgi:hypothetical protein
MFSYLGAKRKTNNPWQTPDTNPSGSRVLARRFSNWRQGSRVCDLISSFLACSISVKRVLCPQMGTEMTTAIKVSSKGLISYLLVAGRVRRFMSRLW